MYVYVFCSDFGYVYWMSGDVVNVKCWVLLVLVMDFKGNFDGFVEYVYCVLYEVVNKVGDYCNVLEYYWYYWDVLV